MPILEDPESNNCSGQNGSSEFNGEEVYVNVYDLHWPNGMKMGAYHTGTVVYGKEYGYGGHPFPSSGIYEIDPMNIDSMGDEFSFKKSIYVGRTYLSSKGVNRLLGSLGDEFQGNSYHLLHYNCNHFTAHFIELLCHATLPGWINRLARVAAGVPFIESMLPPQWVRPSLMYQSDYDDDDDDDDDDDGDEQDDGDADDQTTNNKEENHPTQSKSSNDNCSSNPTTDAKQKTNTKTSTKTNTTTSTNCNSSGPSTSSSSSITTAIFGRRPTNHSTRSDKTQASHSRLIFIRSENGTDKSHNRASSSKPNVN